MLEVILPHVRHSIVAVPCLSQIRKTFSREFSNTGEKLITVVPCPLVRDIRADEWPGWIPGENPRAGGWFPNQTALPCRWVPCSLCEQSGGVVQKCFLLSARACAFGSFWVWFIDWCWSWNPSSTLPPGINVDSLWRQMGKRPLKDTDWIISCSTSSHAGLLHNF